MKITLLIILILLTGCTRTILNKDIYKTIKAIEDIDVIILDGYNNSGGEIYADYLYHYWSLGSGAGQGEVDLANIDSTDANRYYLKNYSGTLGSAPFLFSNARGEFAETDILITMGTNETSPATFFYDGWFKTSTTGTQQGILSTNFWVSSGGYNRLFITTADILRFDVNPNGGGANLTSTTTVTDGQWHYYFVGVLAESGADQVRLYIDTVQEDSAAGGTTGVTTSPLYIHGDGIMVVPTTHYPLMGYMASSAIGNITGKSWADLEAIQAQRYNGGQGSAFMPI